MDSRIKYTQTIDILPKLSSEESRFPNLTSKNGDFTQPTLNIGCWNIAGLRAAFRNRISQNKVVSPAKLDSTNEIPELTVFCCFEY